MGPMLMPNLPSVVAGAPTVRVNMGTHPMAWQQEPSDGLGACPGCMYGLRDASAMSTGVKVAIGLATLLGVVGGLIYLVKR